MPYGRFPRLNYPNKPTEPPKMETAYPFEQALVWLKGGRKITRRGWNGQGMYIYLVAERTMEIGSSDETTMLIGINPEGLPIKYDGRIDMKYANGKYGVWTPTHEDLLAGDWTLLQ